MKFEDVKYLSATIADDWCFGSINGVADNSKKPKMPNIYVDDNNDEVMTFTVNVETGEVIDWKGKKGVVYALGYKVRDCGGYYLYNKDLNPIATYDGYVPEALGIDDDNYGDYVYITIINNMIQNWKWNEDLYNVFIGSVDTYGNLITPPLIEKEPPKYGLNEFQYLLTHLHLIGDDNMSYANKIEALCKEYFIADVEITWGAVLDSYDNILNTCIFMEWLKLEDRQCIYSSACSIAEYIDGVAETMPFSLKSLSLAHMYRIKHNVNIKLMDELFIDSVKEEAKKLADKVNNTLKGESK